MFRSQTIRSNFQESPLRCRGCNAHGHSILNCQRQWCNLAAVDARIVKHFLDEENSEQAQNLLYQAINLKLN